MALDEAGLGQVSEWLSSIFQSNTIEADSGGDVEGWIEGGMPEGTTPADVASCAPGAASSTGGAYQSNYAGSSYAGHAAPATMSVAHEVSYVTNITNQSNVFIIGDNNQVQVGQGETVQQNQNAINVENPDYPEYDPEYEPPYGEGEGEGGEGEGEGGENGDDPPPENGDVEPEPDSEDEEHAINTLLRFHLKTLDTGHSSLRELGLEPETVEHFGSGFCRKGLMKDRVAIALHNQADELIGYAGLDPASGAYQHPENLSPLLLV